MKKIVFMFSVVFLCIFSVMATAGPISVNDIPAGFSLEKSDGSVDLSASMDNASVVNHSPGDNQKITDSRLLSGVFSTTWRISDNSKPLSMAKNSHSAVYRHYFTPKYH